MNTRAADSGVTLDALDRSVVGALQIDGRAEISRLAAVLEVSPRTVARRLNRLLHTGALRIVRAADPAQAIGSTVLRVRVLRGKVDTIAQSFARRPDVLTADIVLGGEEINVVLTGSPLTRDRLLHHQLPATGAITATTAHSVLHVFADAAHWRADVLTPDQVCALAPAHAGSGTCATDALDDRLLEHLRRDARLSHATLAQLTGTPESTVRRRLRRLADAGMLRTHAVVDPRLLGMDIDAALWLQLPPARLREAGRTLAAHPHTHAVAATTGPANLIAAVYCPDLASLYTFTTDVLGPLGVTSAETAIIARTAKPVGAP
ncbi:Lrp/AsnC family transcriptional regulator [Streptomyces sp. NRRL F-4474]|uniref:Lrp/AsnC family transcriptional regulator n=1 Tax=Streptomyces sp. NRRL F-4474 TaxID=1463851 RepID=UPI0004C9336D|nr:Lrp/AsnC family transcriptional regulator [Streptomyces sp. NRRL F-4474]